VIVETAIESYQFNCARCAAQWTESYEVRQVTDEEGAVDSLYRYHGAPCAAPVGGNVRCLACGSTQVRKDPLYVTPVAEVEIAVELPVTAPLIPRQRAAWGTWHRFKFAASITMDADVPGARARHRRLEYPSGVPGLLVRAHSVDRPSVHQYFPALCYVEDRRPLRLGDAHVPAIVAVPDDDASSFFQAGQRFTLWDGADIGRGTVAQRIVGRWPELA